MAGVMAMVCSLLLCQMRVVWESFACTARMSVLFALGKMGNSGAENREGGSKHGAYEGVVFHERRHPVRHKFEYRARYAFVNLDKTPSWFNDAVGYHMTAEQARSFVGTVGPVYLLCMPTSCGYEQNPLSVYYCYDDDAGPRGSSVPKTVAEVTNTPWAERVTFEFDSSGDTAPKSLHVSPFMDMAGTWKLHASPPTEKLSLTIRVDHPEYGEYFVATLRAKRVHPGASMEWFLWMMPQRVAIWIYWQALVLIWKGVKIEQHPKYIDGDLYRKHVEERDAEMRHGHVHPGEGHKAGRLVPSRCPRLFEWREADGYPWL